MRLAGTGVFLRHLAGQARFPFRPWEEIRRAQEARLARMVQYACEHVPRYRALRDRLGMRPEDVRSVEDLAAWPTLESNEVARLGAALFSGGRQGSDWIGLRSGGTTGSPKRVYFEPRSFLANLAYRERSRSIISARVGRRTGYREAVLFGHDGVVAQTEAAVSRFMWAPRFMRVERRFFAVHEGLDHTLAGLAKFRPHHVFGLGSFAARVFERHLEGRGEFPLPAAVSYTSDEMPAEARRMIERDLGVPVFSLYNAVEGFNLGFECGEGEGLHMNVDLYPFRIVDDEGRTLPPGETGSIVLSNVVTRGTVFLNYRIGDRGRLLTEPCPCGRNLPRLAGFDGRDDEWALLADGSRMHSQDLRVLTVSEIPLWQFRIVQEAVDHFRVKIVLAEEVDRAKTVEGIERRMREGLGPGVRVEVAFVEELPRTSGGKSRTFESRLGAASVG